MAQVRDDKVGIKATVSVRMERNSKSEKYRDRGNLLSRGRVGGKWQTEH